MDENDLVNNGKSANSKLTKENINQTITMVEMK